MKHTCRANILIAAAHPSEADVAVRAAKLAGVACEIITTGVGGAAMSWSLNKWFAGGVKADLIINAGIAGSFKNSLVPGDVVMPVSDCFADMGIDDNGTFMSLFRANLADPDQAPFTNGRIICNNKWVTTLKGTLRQVTAATVNMTSGSEPVISRIVKAWDPEIETMEGAWFAYSCTMHKTDYISVRAVSNFVEPRDKARWNIPFALERLHDALVMVLETIRKQ